MCLSYCHHKNSRLQVMVNVFQSFKRVQVYQFNMFYVHKYLGKYNLFSG